MDTRANRDDWGQEFERWKSLKARKEQYAAKKAAESVKPAEVKVEPLVELEENKVGSSGSGMGWWITGAIIVIIILAGIWFMNR